MGGFISPTLNYSLLAPIMIVLAGALIGVLVEAFASRDRRAAIQLPVTLATLAFSLGWVFSVRGSESTDLAGNSVVFDGSAFLIQSFVLIISILGTLLIADQENFTSSASALPGSQVQARRRAEVRGTRHAATWSSRCRCRRQVTPA